VRNITALTALCNREGRLLRSTKRTPRHVRHLAEIPRNRAMSFEGISRETVKSVRQLNDSCYREPERTSRCDQTVRRPHILSPELRLGEVNLGVVNLGKVMSG